MHGHVKHQRSGYLWGGKEGKGLEMRKWYTAVVDYNSSAKDLK